MDSKSPKSISRWLAALELSQYAKVFEENDIHPNQLSSLDHSLLKELGISSMGHRIKILDSLKPDKKDTSTAPAAPDSGYRTISVVFIDLADSTALSESIDPESFRQLILNYQDVCSNAITQYGGFIARYFGDGILAYFGYPAADEDDTTNSARAALSALQAFAEYSTQTNLHDLPQLSVRIGIATGQTLVGDIVGEGASQEATALGRIPNLAARVQSCADGGEVMLCEETATLLQGRFNLEPMGDQHFKGIESPQTLYRLLSENQNATRFEHRVSIGLHPLVGRETEFNLLLDLVTNNSDSSSITHITGEAGIGKSRLLHELQQTLDNRQIRFLSGQCSPDATNTPYYPLVNLIKRFCAISTGSNDVTAPREATLRNALNHLHPTGNSEVDFLLQLLGQDQQQLAHLPPELSGKATEDALLWFLSVMAKSVLRIIIIEDIHWIDSASIKVIERYLADNNQPALTWIVTQRSGTQSLLNAGKPGERTVIELDRLTTSQIKVLIANSLGESDLPRDRINEVVDRCDGNPLFAEEIIRQIDKTNPDGEIPATIDSMFQQQFDSLDPGLQQCLRNASVLGREFSLEALVLMPQHDRNITNAIDTLRDNNIITDSPDSGFLAFKHALIRDAVYNSMLRDLRNSLHLCAAEAIESIYTDNPLSVVDTLASHYAHTDQTEKKVEYLLKSGDRSLSLYSLDAAETRFEQALSTLETDLSENNLIQRAEIALKLCRVFYFQYNFRRIVERAQPYLDILSATKHPTIYSRLLSECGYANVFRGAAEQGKMQLSEALKLGELHGNPETIGYASLGLSWYYAHWCSAGPKHVTTAFEHAFRTASKCGQDTSDLWLESKAWMSAGCFHLSRGRFNQAIECCEYLYQLSDNSNDPRPRGLGHYIHSVVMSFQEDYVSALKFANTALQNSISPLDRVTSEAAAIYARLMSGEHHSALTEYRELLNRVERNEFRVISFYNIDAPYGLALILSGSMSAGEQHIWSTMRRYQSFGLVMADACAHYYVGKFYAIVALSDERPSLPVMLKNATYLMRIVPRIYSLAVRELTKALDGFEEAGNVGFSADAAWVLFQLYKKKKQHRKADALLKRANKLARQSGHSTILNAIEQQSNSEDSSPLSSN